MEKNTTATKQVKELKAEAEELVNTTENKVEELKTKVTDNFSNLSEKASEKLDSGKKLFEEKAKDLGEFVQQKVDSVNQLGHRAADAISESSEYLKNIDIDKARESVKVRIKEQPELTLVAVGILGLIVGYLVGKRTIR